MTHKHEAPGDVAKRIKEWLGPNGRENTASLLLYEAMQALEGVARAQADARPVAWIEKAQLEQLQDVTADAWVYWRETGHVAEADEIALFTTPPAESAGVALLSDVAEWHKARQAYIEAVATYNARVAFARETERQDPKLFGTIKVDTEWHLMNEAQNKMGALIEPMGKALDAYFAHTHEAVHTDDAAVDRCAIAMKGKLAQARNKGRGGWEQCDPVELSIMLREHVEKGDPIDVANFCMFLWNLGKPISDAALPYGNRAAQQLAEPPVTDHSADANKMVSDHFNGYVNMTSLQVEPGADEWAAFEAWLAAHPYPITWRERSAFFAGYRVTNSGQRAGVADDAVANAAHCIAQDYLRDPTQSDRDGIACHIRRMFVMPDATPTQRHEGE